ncbi:SRPBCC family protein [Bdellovibrio sp. 22V]|uniref:SRPBCC family protein n=1 Tax=Bdellovibrio sp. 22V TaxID=3044166 RepID=UPI0025430979|nr:SRPBCC family protein [Bdellovibrio sp. 22V]WII71497.1 SRPBCC family protein [Bdellovibrio sp. 22V]
MEKENLVPKGETRQRLLDEELYTEEAVTILATPQELYQYWRDPSHFVLFTDQLQSVTEISETRSHWVWKALKGRKTIEWDSEIVEDIPNSVIAWRAHGDQDIQHSGRVEFQELPYGRGTTVKVKIAYDAPAGKMLNVLEKLLGESPHRNLKMNLFKLRELFEAGEVPTVEGQPAGHNREHETKTALH